MMARRCPPPTHNLQSPQVALGEHSLLCAWFVQDLLGVCARFMDGDPQHMLCSEITDLHFNGRFHPNPPSNKPQAFLIHLRTSTVG